MATNLVKKILFPFNNSGYHRPLCKSTHARFTGCSPNGHEKMSTFEGKKNFNLLMSHTVE